MTATLEGTEPKLDPGAPLRAWAEAAIARRAEKMLDHAEGVRAGTDIEEVHDMRVASRRLAAAMRVFHACFPGPRYAALYREARRVTRRLGAVRDLDVLIDHFERQRAAARRDEPLGIEYMVALLARRRARARKPLLPALDALEHSDYPRRLREFFQDEEKKAEATPPGVVPCPASFRNAAPHYLEERRRAFYEQAACAGDPHATTELHELRIRAKWLRYTMELFAPAYADDLKKPLASVKRLQELLGDLHDADVRLALLGEVLARPLKARLLAELRLWLPDPVVGSLRVLLADEEAAREGIYRAFSKEWEKLEARGFRAALGERLRNPDA